MDFSVLWLVLFVMIVVYLFIGSSLWIDIFIFISKLTEKNSYSIVRNKGAIEIKYYESGEEFHLVLPYNPRKEHYEYHIHYDEEDPKILRHPRGVPFYGTPKLLRCKRIEVKNSIGETINFIE